MDRNQDKDFDDTVELVWSSGNQFKTGNIVSNIYLPITKIDSTGLTRLRISLKAVSSIIDTIKPTPCGFFNFGEVEDYDITLVASDPCIGTPTPGTTIASPTLVCSGSNVNFSLEYPDVGAGAILTGSQALVPPVPGQAQGGQIIRIVLLLILLPGISVSSPVP